ncbi:MAG: two-component system response regulator MtrA [Phototrophicaceae bacterium]
MVTSLLIVEPEREKRLELITAFGNSSHPFKVWGATSAEVALQVLDYQSIDMVITELHLPDMSGFLFLDYISQVTHIIVYSDGDESVLLRAYEHDIDDFATKSQTTIAELVLRAQAILRRLTERYLQSGDICVDIAEQRVWRNEIEIDLSRQTFNFFLALARHPNQVITRNELADAVGSTRDTKGYRVLYVLALAVRRKIEPDPENPRYIQNIRGIGYMLRTKMTSENEN